MARRKNMFTGKLAITLLILTLILADQTAAQEVHITPLKEGYLRDDVGLLNREQRKEIISLLEGHNKSHLGRVYLDILRRLPEGKSIERYAYDRLNQLPKLPNERADKVMLVVVLENKALRIETSREVQQVLTDEYCRDVNRRIIIPYMKRGEYQKGIKAGLMALIGKLRSA